MNSCIFIIKINADIFNTASATYAIFIKNRHKNNIGIRDIEVFFKVCKSYLHLSKECRSISYDAMTAHTAVVFTRYMMLSVENRQSNDERSLGELFLYFSDEMSDITWIQAFQLLLQMFRSLLADTADIADEEIDKLVDAFMDALPELLKSKLQAA